MVRLMPMFATNFYHFLIRKVDKRVPASFRPLWEHPIGPKTIFFYCPFAKGTLVLAGLGDLARPADKLSLDQQAALFVTGSIWARYSLIIVPKNYGLFFVNSFVATMGGYQLSKIGMYRYGTNPTK